MCCSIALGVLQVFLDWNQHMATLHYAYELMLGVLGPGMRTKDGLSCVLIPSDKSRWKLFFFFPCIMDCLFCAIAHYSGGRSLKLQLNLVG